MKKSFLILSILVLWVGLMSATNIGPWQNGGTDIGAHQDAGARSSHILVWNSSGSTDMNLASNYWDSTTMMAADAILIGDTLLWTDKSSVSAAATAQLRVNKISMSHHSRNWSMAGFPCTTQAGIIFDGASTADTIRLRGRYVVLGNGPVQFNSGPTYIPDSTFHYPPDSFPDIYLLGNNRMTHNGVTAKPIWFDTMSFCPLVTNLDTITGTSEFFCRYLIRGAGQMYKTAGIRVLGKRDPFYTWTTTTLYEGPNTQWFYADSGITYNLPKTKAVTGGTNFCGSNPVGTTAQMIPTDTIQGGSHLKIIGGPGKFIFDNTVHNAYILAGSGSFIVGNFAGSDTTFIKLGAGPRIFVYQNFDISQHAAYTQTVVDATGSKFNIKENFLGYSSANVRLITVNSEFAFMQNDNSTITARDAIFDTITINKAASTRRLTIGDSLRCDVFISKAGVFNQNSKIVRCTTLVDTSVDSSYYSGPLYISGSIKLRNGTKKIFSDTLHFLVCPAIDTTGWGGTLPPITYPAGCKQFTLTENSVHGSVTFDPAGGVYDSGTSVQVSASADACYSFTSWSDSLSGSTNPTTITMNSNKIVTANFTAADSFTITSSAGANGTIDPDGATKVACGGSQSYSISADGGYIIDSVVVDGVSEGAISSKDFTNVTANHTIAAYFRVQPSSLHSISAASIDSDSTGSVIKITIDGIDSGATFNYGIGAWNTATAATPYLSVKTPGFDSTGAPSWVTKTVYITHTMRKVYPNEAADSTATSGDDFVVNGWLSGKVTNKDTVRLNVPKAWFINGSDSSDVVSNLLVTNSSAIPPKRMKGNWSYRRDYSRVSDSVDLRCCVYHRSADSGQLVRAVQFTVTDAHSHTATAWARTPSRTMSDITNLCIIEYRAMVPVASFTDLDTLTCNFMAFPREGDSAACINTGDGAHASPSPMPCPIYFLCDKSGTYGVTVAVVGDTTGQGGAGAAVDSASFDSASPPNMYNRIYLAVNAVSAYNNTNHSRNNASAGTVYLKAGNYSYSGGTITAGTFNNFSYLTIRPFPGVSRDSVVIDSGVNTKAAQLKVRFYGLTINKRCAGSFFDGHRNVLFDSCVMKGDSTAAFIKDSLMVFHKCLIKNFGSGIYPYTGVANPVLIRECIFRGFAKKTYPFMVIGCKRDSLVANTEIFITADLLIAGTADTLDNFFIGFNEFKYMSSATKKSIDLGNTNNWHYGGAIIQNLFESVDSVPATYFGLCDGSAAGTINNDVDLVLNTNPRARSNTVYNDAGTAVHWRARWTFYGNTWAKLACKQDQFAPASGVRVGGWGTLNGAGVECCLWPEIKDQPGTITFLLEYAGMNSFQEGTTANPVNYYKWANDACHKYTGDSLSAGTGGGDYRPSDSSPVIGRSLRRPLPWDLKGNVRRFGGAIGAYESLDTLAMLYGSQETAAESISVPCSTMAKVSGDSVKVYLQIYTGGAWSTRDSTAWTTVILKDTLSAASLSSGTAYPIRLKGITTGTFDHVDTTQLDTVTTDAEGSYIYVRDGGTGDGSAWGNDLDQIPATIPRGDTVLVADGSYNTYECNDAANGSIYNTIRKATASSHGSSTGWLSSYGDGQAVIEDRFYVTTSYWTIDGMAGGGPGSWTDSTGYGFKIQYDDTVTAWKLFRIATGCNNIKLRHTMLIYTANADETDSTISESQDTYYCLGSDSSEISYCSFWHAGRCHMLTRNFDNALVQYNYFHRNKTCLRQHAQSIDDHGGSNNWTFRYNLIRKNMGTGIIVVLDDGAPDCDTSDAWKIYGNVFWGGERDDYDVTDGPIVVINNKFANNWRIYNNTFINVNGQGSFGNRFFEAQCTSCGHEIRNNLWVGAQDSVTWGWSTGDVNSVITHEYFETGTRHKAVTSEQIYPDTIPAYASYDFSLETATDAGYTLASPYNLDMLGNTRGADGNWDRGAIEFSGAPPGLNLISLVDTTIDSVYVSYADSLWMSGTVTIRRLVIAVDAGSVAYAPATLIITSVCNGVTNNLGGTNPAIAYSCTADTNDCHGAFTVRNVDSLYLAAAKFLVVQDSLVYGATAKINGGAGARILTVPGDTITIRQNSISNAIPVRNRGARIRWR